MNISANVLRRFVILPSSTRAIRELLDDIGIEVKRIEEVDDDLKIGVELLANRGDHYCYSGIAREVSGRTGAAICGPEFTPLQVGDGGPVVRNDTDLCGLYTGTLMEKVNAGKSLPEEVLRPLVAAGINPLIAPVDATNLSNLEIGQPTHVFDADKIVGDVVIRLSIEGEQAWPLFQEKHVPVPAGTVVIADEVKILAIAGVIGCEDSKCTDETTRILVESAAFDPVSVRKSSRKLNIHTDSVARFERGSDFSLPLVGAGRVVFLLEVFAGWKRIGQTTSVGAWVDPNRVLSIESSRVCRFLDVTISVDEMSSRLRRYGFSCSVDGDRIDVTVPPHRLWDVEFPADLYEEIAKSIGYNNTPTLLPLIDKGNQPSRELQIKQQVEEVLLGNGFYEVITNGFYGRGLLDKLGVAEGHPLFAHVEVLNALDRGYSKLKNNAFGQALEAVSRNMNRKHSNIKMYEWTRTFHLDEGAENAVCSERTVLWGMVSGPSRIANWSEKSKVADPIYLKGLVEEIALTLRLPFAFAPSSPSGALYDLLHPYRQASIVLNGKVVGVLGEVHPEVLRRFKLKKVRPCYFELSEEVLYEKSTNWSYAEPPVHQPLNRTLAFALPLLFPAEKIREMLAKSGADVKIVDLFAFSDEGKPMRSITYELDYPNHSGTVSADSVNIELRKVTEQIIALHGSDGVYQR